MHLTSYPGFCRGFQQLRLRPGVFMSSTTSLEKSSPRYVLTKAMFQPAAATFKESGRCSGDMLLSRLKEELKEKFLAGYIQRTDVELAV